MSETTPPKVEQKADAAENYSVAHIWRSALSWRITLTAFATILLIQTVMLIFSVRNYEQELLGGLVKIAHASLTSTFTDTRDQAISPIPEEAVAKMLRNSVIEGVTVYGLNLAPIQSYGAKTEIVPRLGSIPEPLRSADKEHYEVMLLPSEIQKPYNIVVRMNAQSVAPLLGSHIRQTLLTLLLMSGFVTSVLMIALSEWLLEPLFILRGNLSSAADDPEQPELRRLKNELKDEMGMTMRIANDLIRQNAASLKKLRVQAEDKIHKLAYYDPLTGLPNRTYFIEKLDEYIRTKVLSAQKAKLAVFSIDIDHFKDVNDTMGHEMGDKLLDAVGKRLVRALPLDVIVTRASADEFIVLAPLTPEHPDDAKLIERIFESMRDPIAIQQETFQAKVSIGVAHCPDDGLESRQVLKNADIALNRAKEEGRDTVRYYSQDFDQALQKRVQMLRDLRVAVEKNELQVFYQPQFDLKTGRMVGAEALLRWFKPDAEGGHFIPPSEFIPVAEQAGLIVPIGEFVLRTACAQNKKWQETLPPFRVAVNLSGVQFQTGHVVETVKKILTETGLAAQWLELEVTESIFMDNVQSAIDTLNKLNDLGVELALDDFGTGYSSLSYLRQFPIDRLKIDQSFVRNALVNEGDKSVARTIITLGHSLGLKVIAEGVETEEHEAFLKAENCDESQGYKYSKPIPADQFFTFALKHNGAPPKT